MKFYVHENNSGGYTVALGVLDDKDRFHWVEIEAESVDDAVHQFEAHFNLDWNNQNSFEGNSCSCCGRRFTIYAPKGHTATTYVKYGDVADYTPDDMPYFENDTFYDGTKKPGGPLALAPVNVKTSPKG